MEKAISLMERQAKRYPLLSRKPASKKLPPIEKRREELASLRSLLPILFRELEEAREVVREKEKKFTLLANYKFILEESLTSITVCPSPREKKRKKTKVDILLEKLNSLTPAQREYLKTLEVD